MDEKAYMKEWVSLNDRMSKKGFIWGAMEEEEDYEQYMSFDVYKMPQSQWDYIQVATAKIGNIMNKTYKEIMKNTKYLNLLGIAKSALGAVAVPSDYFSYFTRMDLIVNNGQVKVIEVNCDTPTGYLETSVANEIICSHHGCLSPNSLEAGIYNAWSQIIEEYGITEEDTVYFTSYGWHDEDRETTLFNMKYSELHNTRYIDIGEIVVGEDGLYDEDGNKIVYLYRLYPLEYLPEDKDEDGNEIGNLFLDHIAKGRVKVINPPSAFLMQSKSIMAIIWNMYEENRRDVFTQAELKDIEEFFLPTYFTPFEFEGKPYVEKPIFGREGGGVSIFDEEGQLVTEDEEHWYKEWPSVFQAYAEMPDYTIDTWTGEYTGKLLIGSFLIGGEPSGLFLRVGEKITGNLSMFCGITTVPDSEVE